MRRSSLFAIAATSMLCVASLARAQDAPRPLPPLSLTTTGPADWVQSPTLACACGCGIFDVATSSMLPHGQGGMVWLEWDYQDQNRSRHGDSAAPAAANEDKDIRTGFYTLGFQYFFDRSWGLRIELPAADRHLATADASYDWAALGDIRIRGVYAGFSEDQSIGVDFGLKLPTGNFTHGGVDRDTQIGTGSTDILLGGFYRTALSGRPDWTFFAQVAADLPVLTRDDYRPGFEANGAAGVYYTGFTFHGMRISPVAQVIVAYRAPDGGDNSAHPTASGYQRVLLSPGVELDMHPFSIYADVELPVYEYFRGNQLAAPALFKLSLSYSF